MSVLLGVHSALIMVFPYPTDPTKRCSTPVHGRKSVERKVRREGAVR